jgi:hypothetical protein
MNLKENIIFYFFISRALNIVKTPSLRQASLHQGSQMCFDNLHILTRWVGPWILLGGKE